MAIKRNGCRSLVRLSFRAPSNFGSKPEWMESSCRTGIFPSIHFLMFLSLMESFRLRCINRSNDSTKNSERMVSTPQGQVSTPQGIHTTRSGLRTTRSLHCFLTAPFNSSLLPPALLVHQEITLTI